MCVHGMVCVVWCDVRTRPVSRTALSSPPTTWTMLIFPTCHATSISQHAVSRQNTGRALLPLLAPTDLLVRVCLG